MRLDLQLGVQLLCRPRLFGIDRFHPLFEAAETDFAAAHDTSVEPQRLTREPGQEGAVMADDDERAIIARQPIFQPIDRGDVQMVGRFVQQQQVRLACQRTGDGSTATFAATRGLRFARQVDAELVGNRLHLMRGRRKLARQREIMQRRKGRHVGVLLQHYDPRARLHRACALVRLDQPGDEFQQGRLARAVTPDQRQPVALADMNIDPLEQPVGALREAEIFIGKNRCCHGRAARP